MSKTVRYEVVDRIATITLDRPDQRNAIDASTTAALRAAMDRVETDRDVLVAILTASGDRAFCAGMDLKAFARGEGPAILEGPGGFAGFTHYPRTKPCIAAVNGAALAGGCELVLSCDLVVTADHAVLRIARSQTRPLRNIGRCSASAASDPPSACAGAVAHRRRHRCRDSPRSGIDQQGCAARTAAGNRTRSGPAHLRQRAACRARDAGARPRGLRTAGGAAAGPQRGGVGADRGERGRTRGPAGVRGEKAGGLAGTLRILATSGAISGAVPVSTVRRRGDRRTHRTSLCNCRKARCSKSAISSSRSAAAP